MDSTGKQLLNLMFNPGETICVRPNLYSYHSISLESAMEGTISLVPPDSGRPTQYYDSSELLLVALNPILGFCKDANVQKYRSFLFELDTGSIRDQLGYFQHLQIPLSAQVFSGNKSVHSLLTLSSDRLDEKTYRLLYQWCLNIMTLVDRNCKNPSRSIRIPGAYREPGKKQRLISIGERVTISEFLTWLNRYPHLRPRAKEKRIIVPGTGSVDRLSKWAKGQLKYGMKPTKGRNQHWFGMGYDFAQAGYSEGEAIEILSRHFNPEHDFSENEFLTCIASAYKIVSEGRHG